VIEADFDTGTPSGKMMRHMLVGFAAFDRDALVERMGRGQHAMAERGGWPGGKQAPYGYRARKLIAEVLWGRTEKTHRSSRATGKYGPTVVVKVEPILSQERFNALQKAMTVRARGQNKPRQIYPLSARLICFCGQPFGGSFRSDRELRQYRCRATKWSASGEATCDARRIEADWIEGVVWDEVLELLSKPERLLATVHDYLELREGQVTVERDEAADVAANIARLERALNRALRSSYMDDEPDAHHEVVAQIRQDLIEAHARRQLLAEWTRESQEQSGRMRDVWALSEVAVERLGRMSFGQRQQVLALLDLRVTVLDPRTEGPARGGFQGGLGPARPRIHIKGSVPPRRPARHDGRPWLPDRRGQSSWRTSPTSRRSGG